VLMLSIINFGVGEFSSKLLVLLTLNCIQRDEKCRLDNAKEELESLKYHPLRKHKPVSGGENEHKVKRKKLKSCNDCESDDNFSIRLKSQNYLLPNMTLFISQLLVRSIGLFFKFFFENSTFYVFSYFC